jgi:hypothetical protein
MIALGLSPTVHSIQDIVILLMLQISNNSEASVSLRGLYAPDILEFHSRCANAYPAVVITTEEVYPDDGL